MKKQQAAEDMDNKKEKKLWGGRFEQATEDLVEDFTASVHFDKRLFREDISGSKAHARMLARQGIITEEDAEAIVAGLDAILREIEEGKFQWKKTLEDVHMNIEQTLIERIGDAGRRLHTARSRNDQIATDVRLYLKAEILDLDQCLHELQQGLVSQAERHIDIVMPGYTHLQRAQPILWSHHLLAYFEMFRRDRERLQDCLKRVDSCPLGSAALAGTGFPIDRDYTARKLGFSRVSRNSLDAVSDRDFIIEFLAAASLVMAHLSRLSEELVLWSSQEFDFVELPDSFCTGSSIMPQKKNPDVPELVRGKTGRVYGHLMAALTLIKGLPMAYNRDLQEDKEILFDAVDTVNASVKIMAALVAKLKPKKEKMEQALCKGFLTATDFADYLVQKGVPFRTAHEIVGKAVAMCLHKGVELHELPISELKKLNPLIDEKLYALLTPEGSVESRRSKGGTASIMVKAAIEEAKEWLKSDGEPLDVH